MALVRGLLVLLTGYLALRFALPVTYPLLLALMLAAIVEPLVRALSGHGLPRSIAAIAALGSLGTLVLLGAFWLVRAAVLETWRLSALLPAAILALSRQIAVVWPAAVLGPAPKLSAGIFGSFSAGAFHVAAQLPDIALATLVSVVGAYFLARDRPVLTQGLAARLPDIVGTSGRLGQVAWRATVNYLRVQLVLASVTATVTAVALALVGAPYALLAALCVGLLDVAPGLGPATVLAPWGLLEAAFGHVGLAVRLGAVLLLSSLVRPVLEPRLVGGRVGLHPLVALGSMYVGLRLFGVVGFAAGPVLVATAWAAYLGEAQA
jgi:predicted PurR-regulated permease PerM